MQALLQTAALIESIPEQATVALVVMVIPASRVIPTRYGVERLEGLGRFRVSKLP